MTDPHGPESVVVIDDDYAIRLSCSKILSKMGLQVETFDDGARGLEGVARLKPGLVVVDLKMPGISGLDVVSRVHAINAQVIIVVITGYATIDTAVEAMKSGAYDFLPKPFSAEELRLIVNRGLDRRRLALESQRAEIEHELLKRRFITFVSHQLRTPLVAIHQTLDVLQQLEKTEDSPARRQEWIERCLKRTEELQKLIVDWLTVARVEGGALFKERTDVDLKPVVSAVLENYQGLAAAEGVSLEARLPEEEIRVRGDRDCLSILFDNLVTNAIKYNKRGGSVVVSGSLTDGEVAIAVADTGLGIPEKYRPYLFDEFFRIKEGGKRTEGSGLGLHISKRIVAEMGGSIEVESQAGAGSTFRVRLPVWRPPAEGAEKGGTQ
ncbi:MAG: HAMP domain-containing sensor histidine kinase [Bryobacteraceae bacterium]|jgi:signal transduction histidine kinase